MAKRSKIEIKGWEARHYDCLMRLAFLGRYQAFVANVTAKMRLAPGDSVLDLGCGPGRHARAVAQAVGPTGRVVGVDISEEMLRQAQRRRGDCPNASFVRLSILQSLPFGEAFDDVLISFVLHGFEDEDKERVIHNARAALKPGGTFWILDYNDFDLSRLWLPLRWAFRHLECELAQEFLRLDLPDMLSRHGFGNFTTHLFYRNHVRLLGAEKLAEPMTGESGNGTLSF